MVDFQGLTPLAINFRPVGTKIHDIRLSRNAAKVNSLGRKPLETTNYIALSPNGTKVNSQGRKLLETTN